MSRLLVRFFWLIGGFLIASASPALADMPVFSAQCPQGNYVDADRTGTVRVNGAVARLERFNDNYYEATVNRVTYTISKNPDGSGLQVGYNPPGNRGGYCTILSSGRPPANRPGGGGGSNIARVTGVAGDDVLNIRSGPGTGYRVVGALANGDRVRVLACRPQGNSRWCEIRMMTDMRESGWVNARFLDRAGGSASNLPSRPPQGAPPGTSSTQRVRFAPGTSSASIDGKLTAGSSIRYVLGARNGRFLDISIRQFGTSITYQIFNPDNSFLLDQISADQPYRGQLWQSGDHVIEVINRGNRATSFIIGIGIR